MESASQISERARRRDHDERRYVAMAHQILKCTRDPVNEAVFLEVMPVGLFHAAAAVGSRALDATPGPVGALLMGRRVFLGEHALGPQIGELLVPALRRNSALRPSPTNIMSVVG